jgi:heterodisulfide reductase subunit B
MDRLFEVLGAESVPFALKTFCCGGHMAQISAETGFEMIHKIVKNAAENGADAIVTVCPMCQLNLDVYQDSANKLFDTDYQVPILFFTQVLGLALGLKPSDLGIGQEFVDAMPAINKISEVPPPKPKRERRDKQALPMPVMPE